MPIYKCSKCIPTNIPVEMIDEQKSHIASLVRTSNPILALQKIKNLLDLSLADAKNIALHITHVKGLCHYCSSVLDKVEGNCLKCERLNLDW